MYRVFLFLTVALTLGACGSVPPARSQAGQSEPPGSAIPTPSSANCSIYVYRNKTSFHALNPERPFLYVGNEKFGTMAIGQSYCLRLGPGKYSISIREPILFMPSYTSDRLEVEVKAGELLYVRYAKEFSGVVSTGSTATVTGNSRLQLTSEEQWRARQ